MSNPTAAPPPPVKIPNLYNPFLDALFNCRNCLKLPCKRILDILANDHNAYTILVPPAHILREHVDSSSSLLIERCYTNEDFVSSHILRSATPVSLPLNSSLSLSAVFTTMNGKQILVKNNTIFTGKGFKQSHRADISSYNHFTSFANYYPRGSKFMVIFINDCLFINRHPLLLPNSRRPSKPDAMRLVSHPSRLDLPNARPSSSPSSSSSSLHLPQNPAPVTPDVNEQITFIKLLRDFPVLSNAVSSQFYNLFHHNNKEYTLLRHSTRKRLSDVQDTFMRMVKEAYQYVLDSVKTSKPDSEQTYTMLTSILRQYPGLDMNRLVFEYVEFNMYDAVWAQITLQFNYPNSTKLEYDPEAIKVLTLEAYSSISCLLLNHLDVPARTPWQINLLADRIRAAISELARWDDPGIVSCNEKIRIINNTIFALTANTDSPVDADTLMGILIMVLVHARVKDFDAHLYYIKNYCLVDLSRNGALSYTLSNLEAVLCHLSPYEPHFADLVDASTATREFWNAIDTVNVAGLQEMVQGFAATHGDTVPHNHCLYLRDVDGQDCIMRAVRSGSFAIYSLLVHSHPAWFATEDFLFSKLLSTGQTLLMVALQEGHLDIARDVVSIVLENTTVNEQAAYFACTDKGGRHTGHYLFHDAQLMKTLGHIVDWDTMDDKSRTPLMCVCRCYDHPEYPRLLALAFRCVSRRHGNDRAMRWFDHHVDRHGNTLLHIVARSLEKTGLLHHWDTIIDVNQVNTRNFSPLFNSVKFGRVENVRALLNDLRLLFMAQDAVTGTTIFDQVNRLVGKASLPEGDALVEIDALLYAHFQQFYLPRKVPCPAVALGAAFIGTDSRSWHIQFRRGKHTVFKSLDTIKQLVHLGKLEYPLLLLPDPDFFWHNYGFGQDLHPFFYRFKINRLLESLLLMLVGVSMQTIVPNESYQRRFVDADESGDEENSGVQTPLMLEKIRGVSRAHDQERRRAASESQVTAPALDEIEYFLVFWRSKLQQYYEAIHRLRILLLAKEYKESDVTTVLQRLMRIIAGVDGRLGGEDHIEHYTPGYLSTFVLEIEQTVVGLLRHTHRLLNKLEQWKEVFRAIESLNNEAHALFEQVTLQADFASRDDTPGLHLPFPLENPLAKLDELIADLVSGQDDGPALFFSFGLVENRLARFRRVLRTRLDFLRRLTRLGGEVRYEHEQLALAYSSHIQQRGQLFAYGTKMHVQHSLRRMRRQHMELLRMQRA